MNKQRISMLATPLMIVCGLLGSGASARAGSEEGACSNRTLNGDYGFAIEGVILAIPGITLPPGGIPLRGVAMTHFDGAANSGGPGKGTLNQVDHVVVGGMPPPVEWTPGHGTYAVNPNCTGTAQIIIPGNPLSPVNLHFVVVRQGKEIHTVVNANAVTSVGIKIE